MSMPVGLQGSQSSNVQYAAAAAAASQSPNVAMEAASVALPPLPKAIPLALLASLEPKMQVSGTTATPETINIALSHHDYFSLIKQLNQTIANEWTAQKFDYSLRLLFADAFTKLQQALTKDIQKIQKGEEDYANLPKQDRDTLVLFASEGRGAESVRIFSKIILDSCLSGDKYPGKIMALAKNSVQIRVNETIPGEAGVLTVERAAKFIGNDREGKPEEKFNCKIDGELSIDKRVSCRQELTARALGGLSQLSEGLSVRVGQLAQLGFFSGEHSRVAFFLRGEQGSGKSAILENNHILGLSEALVFNSNSMKQILGGDLCHHESAAIADEITLRTKELGCTINVKTNTKGRDADSLIQLQKNTANMIMDVDVSLETVQKRLAERKGRVILPEDIEKGHKESVTTRTAVIQAAILNSNINYRLYNNDGDHPVVAAEVINKKLVILDKEKLLQAVGPESFEKLTSAS